MTTTLRAPGMFGNVDFREYLNDPCEGPSLSSSVAKTLLERSPLHAWYEHPRLGGGAPDSGSAAADFGSVTHALALGGGQEYVAVPYLDWRTNDAKKRRDDARAAGLVPILEYQLTACQEVADRIRPLLPAADCQHEVTAVWESTVGHEGRPVLCRRRLDLLCAPRGLVIDLKTTKDAARTAAARALVSDYRDLEAACSLDAVETLLPDLAGRCSFVYLFIEVDPPYASVEVEIAGAMLELGRRRWRRAVDQWGACLAKGEGVEHWPGPFGGHSRPEPPPWALEADLDQQLAGRPANSGGEALGL